MHLEYFQNQFSSVTQSCPTLCDPMNRSKPGLPVHHQLPEFTQNRCPLSWWHHPTISSSVVPFSSCPQSFPASGSFEVKRPWTFRIYASKRAEVLLKECHNCINNPPYSITSFFIKAESVGVWYISLLVTNSIDTVAFCNFNYKTI